MGLSHVDDSGRARMVDVSDKDVTRRAATAEGWVKMSAEAFELVRSNGLEKGDVLTVARIAAVQGAKKTAELIPLCHPLPLDGIDVNLTLEDRLPGIKVTVTTRVAAKTGVEMEALTAVATACLTIYDMVKAVDRAMEIGPIRVITKSGGRSGEYHLAASPAVEPETR